MSLTPEAAAPAEAEVTELDVSPPVALPAAELPVALEDVVPTPVALSPALPPAPALRTARVTSLTGRRATLELRGHAAGVDALVAPDVDPAVVADAIAGGDRVLVETVAGEEPVIVGVLQTRRARELRIRAGTVQIEGDEEVLVRAGRAAIRLRADGDIEVVGSRISAASRGLFRIVGRMLRLN